MQCPADAQMGRARLWANELGTAEVAGPPAVGPAPPDTVRRRPAPRRRTVVRYARESSGVVSMSAAWLWVRADLRRRWRSWVVLGILAGISVGLAAAGVAGARRTDRAVPDYVAAAHVPDAAVLANDPAYDAAKQAQVARLPNVTGVFPFVVPFATNVSTPAGMDTSLAPATAAAMREMLGVLVEGRLPNPARADEIVVNEADARQVRAGPRFDRDLGAEGDAARRGRTPRRARSPRCPGDRAADARRRDLALAGQRDRLDAVERLLPEVPRTRWSGWRTSSSSSPTAKRTS